MAFVTRKLPGAPILIATLNVPLELHLQSLRSLNAEIDRFVQTRSGKTCCLILNMNGLDLTCSDFMIWIDEYRSGTHLFLDCPALTVLAVGTQPVIPIGLKKIERHLRVSIASFVTVAAAVEMAQRVISEVERV